MLCFLVLIKRDLFDIWLVSGTNVVHASRNRGSLFSNFHFFLFHPYFCSLFLFLSFFESTPVGCGIRKGEFSAIKHTVTDKQLSAHPYIRIDIGATLSTSRLQVIETILYRHPHKTTCPQTASLHHLLRLFEWFRFLTDDYVEKFTPFRGTDKGSHCITTSCGFIWVENICIVAFMPITRGTQSCPSNSFTPNFVQWV